jgi:predicted TIM-barrel fold metal-dependent hydrolase
MTMNRRQFGALTAAAMAAAALPRFARAASPLADMPAGAVDCHNHIVGPLAKYPMAANRTYTPPEATVAQLRALRTQLGVPRNVIVQPSFYGFDNSCMLDAMAELGNSVRGIAVVPQTISDAELKTLATKNVVGVRLNLATMGIRDPKAAIDAINAFAPRFVPLGWHIQINTELSVVAAIAQTVGTLKVPVVFDHIANLDASKGVNQPGFGALVDLVKGGNIYVKLSAPYNLSKQPDWADIVPIAQTLIAASPGRMLWGTNWPHPGNARGPITQITPYQTVDNPALLRAFAKHCPDPAIRKFILVDNPARLYRFV